MKRISAYLGLGGALCAAALLVACGGGSGGNAGSSLPSTTQNSGGTTSGSTSSSHGLKLQLAFVRNPKHQNQQTRKKNTKQRMYVSTDAEGLQLAITPTGGATTTLYVDISTTSPLCTVTTSYYDTPDGSEETCSISLPVLGATETVTGTVTDASPASENPTTGLGQGFSGSALVLGVGSTTVTTTGGVNTVALGIGPVAAQIVDCTGYIPTAPDPSNFADDDNGSNPRLVITAGVAVSGYISQEFDDPSGAWYDALPTAAPGFSPVPQNFVDVNGSPEPITFTSSTSNVALGIVTAVGATPSSYASTGSFTTDADYLNDCAFYELVKASPLPTVAPIASPAVPTVTFANNLSATAASPFTGGPYGTTLVYDVVPIAVSPASLSLSMGGSTGTVTGWDYGATGNGMNAESAYDGTQAECLDTTVSTQVDAEVAPSGSINGSTWLESFTVTPSATNTGTCTFVLYDVDTGVVTTPVTVTVST
jgi:hypothetical protein